MATILVAGATGALGRHLLTELKRRGHRTRALVRDPARLPADVADEITIADLTDGAAPLTSACHGADIVVSAAGQATTLARAPDRRGFDAVDRAGNERLFAAARAAGVARAGYVTVFNADRLRGTAYVDAHEAVVAQLRSHGPPATVIRATGFFSAHAEILDAARRGPVPLFAGGRCRSNPVHEADLASVVADALEREIGEVAVGGPEVLTRREEAELAFATLGRRAPLLPMPYAAARGLAALVRPLDRRRAETLAFVAAVSSIDMVAPPHGTRRVGEYLREQAARAG